MADLGGFVGGMMAGQEYAQSKQLFGLKMAEGQQALQEGELTIKEKDLAVQKSQMLLEQQKKMMTLIQGLNTKGQSSATDATVSQANMLGQVGDMQIASGMFEEGRKTLETKTLMLQQNENIIKRTNDVHVSQLKSVTDILGSAPDSPQGWDQARQMVTTLHPDLVKLPDVQKILQLPYRQGLIPALQSSVLNAKEKAQAEEAKAGTAARAAEAAEHNYRVHNILPKEAENIELRNNDLRKHGGDSMVATKDDIKAITDRIQSDPDVGAKIPKEAASVVGEKIAETVAQYRKQGIPLSKAADKAYEEAKQRGELKGLNTPPPQISTAVQKVDNLLAILNQAERENIDVTGMFGSLRRGEEYAGAKAARLGRMTTGTQYKGPEQIANKFESELTALQLELPGILKMPGQFSALKRQDIQTIARGRQRFDSIESSRESLSALREALIGGKPTESGFVTGQVYQDAKGNTATYLGGGKWQKQ